MPKNKGSPEALDQFVDRLLEEKAYFDVDEETVLQIKKDLSDRLEDKINASLLEKMPPENLEEFEKLLDEGNTQKIQEFCQAHILNLDEVVAAALMDFRRLYLNA